MKTKEKETFFNANVSLLFAGVCTNLSPEDATAKLNSESPAGTRNGWALAEDHPLQASQCPDRADCKHYIFEC